MMRLDKRLVKLERCAASRPRSDQFDLLQAVPIDRAEGRSPGVYRTGSARSTARLPGFGPARGKPVVPEGTLAPWGLLIIRGAERVEPPTEMLWYDEPQVA